MRQTYRQAIMLPDWRPLAITAAAFVVAAISGAGAATRAIRAEPPNRGAEQAIDHGYAAERNSKWTADLPRLTQRHHHAGAPVISAASLRLSGVPQRGPEADRTAWWNRAAEGRAGHYWIKTDLAEHDAREIARHLNLIYEAIHQRLGSLPARRPDHLNVFIFQDYEDYLFTLRSRFEINAIGTGGIFFVRGEGGALAIWLGERPMQRIYATLQHEQFHQFAYSRFGSDLPVWVNEGLAMFFGEAVLVGSALVIGQSKPRMIESVKTAIEQDRTIPFADMISISGEQWSQALRDGSAAVQYHQAWSMVHFLIYGDDGRYVSAFERYLRLMNQGVPSEPAFLQAFETDRFDLFEARWKRYMLEDATPSAFVTALERIEFLAEGLLELSRRGILKDDDRRPWTLGELRKALLGIDFTLPVNVHGVTNLISAKDEGVFTIPMDEHARQQPEFVLSEPRLRLRTRRQRAQEEENSTPPVIETRHLRPHSLRIEWKRDSETGTLRYEIIAR